MIYITVEKDLSCKMVKVFDSLGNGMEGNFWDFHNGCHGIYQFGEFNSVEEFIYILEKYHQNNGIETKIIRKEYKYL